MLKPKNLRDWVAVSLIAWGVVIVTIKLGVDLETAGAAVKWVMSLLMG